MHKTDSIVEINPSAPDCKIQRWVAYDKFEDPELRYRQRYVDLVVNDGVKEIF